MPIKLDQSEKRLLYLFYAYGKAISRRKVHELVYILQNEHGLDLGFTFAGQPPFSKSLDEMLKRLVQRGLLKLVYTTGANYLNLYKPYYKLTDKGARIASRSDFAKADKETIEKMVSSIKGAKNAGEAKLTVQQ